MNAVKKVFEILNEEDPKARKKMIKNLKKNTKMHCSKPASVGLLRANVQFSI